MRSTRRLESICAVLLLFGPALLVSACGGGSAGGSVDTGSSEGGSDDGGATDGGTGGSGGGASGVGAAAYKILAANDLGMHCVDADFSTFSILPPFNVVNAQVVRTDSAGRPAILDGTAVAIRYSAVADASGSINSRSSDKTNFWQYVAHTYGIDLPPGEGLKGLYMPAEAHTEAQAAFSWRTDVGLFKAEGIPIFPVDDAGQVNRYPLMRLTASDTSGGQDVATLDVVLPVSEETTCRDCHATGSAAARGASIAWSQASDLEVQSRENVLLLHDSRHGTVLMDSRPVLCAGCHYSPALDLTGAGPSAEQQHHATMSAVMHAYHSSRMMDGQGRRFADQWLAQGEAPPAPDRQACYLCHPGKSTQCLRGAMTDVVTCQNCHGDMTAVGGSHPLAMGGSMDGRNDGGTRRPWLDLPRCQSCHTGDAIDHLVVADASLMASDGLRAMVAFDTADAAASPRQSASSRFAENAQKLFRFSTGHGGVACEGCHNSTHALWPNGVETHNDNVAARQLQGHSGTIIECTTCHGADSLAMSLDGPHGMHVVDDSRWENGGHGSLAERDRQACGACHGSDFRGTVLSRTAAARAWRSRTVAAGTEVGCYDCHNGPGGGD